MSGEQRKNTKSQLALAVANGASVKEWARVNNVPERTAYRWAKEPKVVAVSDSHRRRRLDRAIGRMSRRATWAVAGIAELAEHAVSESVKLSALRSILSDMMTVTQFATLEKRVVQVEAQLHDRERERTGSANRPG